ncbi:MAG TPA: hypothetical protein VF832_04125, partial [Longimicrobiales bacterium]
ITQTLFTNVRKRIAWPAMILVLVGAIAAGVVDLLVSRNVLRLDGYGLLPRSAGVLNYRYYADQRTGDDRYSGAPSIQSDVVHDPYLRLFVPYIPSRDDAVLERACPKELTADRSAAESAAGQTSSAVLACMARLRAVALDGRALDADYRFFTDPQSGLRGLLGYVPLDGLPRGRHVLVVQRPPLAPDATRRDTLQFHADSIPFRL